MTINEIAQIAGVSIGTVDRVIHKRGRVAPETVSRIEKIISENGYKPNPIARQLKLQKQYRIGVLLPLLASECGYWKLIFEGISKAVAELEHMNFALELREFDRLEDGQCYEKGKKLLASGIDALILAPVKQADVLRLIPELGGIPYVFVDSSFPDAEPLTTVVQNPFKSGFCAGRIMDMLVPEARHIVTVQVYCAYNLKERSRGFLEYFRNRKTEVSEIILENASDKIPESAFERLFQANPDVDGLFFTNDSVYQMAEYLKKRGLQDTVHLIGYDLLPQNREQLSEGGIDCIISQCPEKQGYEATRALYHNEILHTTAEAEMFMPIDIYYKENI